MNQNYRNDSKGTQNPQNGPMEQGVKINGLEQVIELLKFADPAFRESLLKRMAQRDPQLAVSLKKMIKS